MLDLRADPEHWKQKHRVARLFFHVNEEQLLALWERVRAGRELRPSVWAEFVEHPDLLALVQQRTSLLSHVTLELVALSELVEEGNFILAVKLREEYFLVSVAAASAPTSLEEMASQGYTREYAIQRFLATVLIYMFVRIYGGDCSVTYVSHPSLELNPSNVFNDFT